MTIGATTFSTLYAELPATMDEYSIAIDPSITTSDGLGTPDDARYLHGVGADTDYTGDGVTIAMVDSGIDTDHPFFDDKDIRDGFDATGNGDPHEDAVGHNTWNIAVPYHTFAPDATVIPIRVFGDQGRTSWETLKKAYTYLYENSDDIDIATFALGSPQESPVLDRWHAKLQKADILAATSAGNSGPDAGSPATAKGTYTIGAVNENGKVTNFSSFEDDQGVPDVTALGRNVIGAATTDGVGIGRQVPEEQVPDELLDVANGPWMKASGTSVSAPIAAFAAAAWLEAQPDSTSPLAAQGAFRRTARDEVDPGKNDPDDGDGLLTFDAAMRGSNGKPSPDTLTGTVWSLPWGDNDFIQLDGDVLDDGEYRFDPDGIRDAAIRED